MDADANPVTPAQYRVTGLPTMNLYYKGEVVRSIVGVRPKSAILSELEEHASLVLTAHKKPGDDTPGLLIALSICRLVDLVLLGVHQVHDPLEVVEGRELDGDLPLDRPRSTLTLVS